MPSDLQIDLYTQQLERLISPGSEIPAMRVNLLTLLEQLKQSPFLLFDLGAPHTYHLTQAWLPCISKTLTLCSDEGMRTMITDEDERLLAKTALIRTHYLLFIHQNTHEAKADYLYLFAPKPALSFFSTWHNLLRFYSNYLKNLQDHNLDWYCLIDLIKRQIPDMTQDTFPLTNDISKLDNFFIQSEAISALLYNLQGACYEQCTFNHATINLENAKLAYKNALQIVQSPFFSSASSTTIYPAIFYTNIATLFFKNNNFIKACHYFKTALECYKQYSKAYPHISMHLTPLALTYDQYSNLLMQMKKYELALHYWNEAIKLEAIYYDGENNFSQAMLNLKIQKLPSKYRFSSEYISFDDITLPNQYSLLGAKLKAEYDEYSPPSPPITPGFNTAVLSRKKKKPSAFSLSCPLPSTPTISVTSPRNKCSFFTP